MDLRWEIKAFQELSVVELYQLLRLRSEVFVVEQKCVYQDIDNKDQKALHLLGIYDDKIVAYARLFDAGDYFDQASIGRVVVDDNFRSKKWGHELMQKAITTIVTEYSKSQITISAQEYLQKFYEENGFLKSSEMYLEDDIPHIQMKRG